MKGYKSWGPQFRDDGSVEFRLWAPSQDDVKLQLAGRDYPMRKTDGWFEAAMPNAKAGSEYGFVLDDGRFVPDPASRRQSQALAGPSLLVPPRPYPWSNTQWKGRDWEESVIYEIHVGTFTPEGSFAAAAEKLGDLAALGVTAVEIMPIAHFPGDRGWGYDGVLQYAPHSAYGTPEDLKAFVDAAHGHGLMAFLDVVYNHFGGVDNYLPLYAPEFFRQDKATPWGSAIAFERPEVRSYFLDNVLYWLGDFKFDGLRLDAVDQISDDSDPHFLEEIALTVRSTFADRKIHLAVENPDSAPELIRRSNGKTVLYDADWNDDFHHSVHVAATGEGVGHYAKFADQVWHNVARTLTSGPIFSKKWALPSAKNAASGGFYPTAYVDYIQNHDQIGNRAFGERLWHLIDDRQVKLWTAMLLLSPQVPLMFMGDHFHADSPFVFFADYAGDIAEAVRNGRAEEARNFGGIKAGKTAADMADPISRATFEKCKLDWSEAKTPKGREWAEFIAGLLALRRIYLMPVLSRPCDAGIVSAQEQQLGVNWKFGSCLLEMRANFTDCPAPQSQVEGKVVYLDGAFEDGVLGAHGIVFACSDA